MYVCLICTIVYVVSDGDEDTVSSTSYAPAIATAISGIVILMVIIAAIVMIILLCRYCRRRRSKSK